MTENYSRIMTMEEVLTTPICSYLIDEAPLSLGVRNICLSMDLEYIGEIIAKTESDFLRQRSCGSTKLNELQSFLAKFGLKLNTHVEGASFYYPELRALQKKRDEALPELQQAAGPRYRWRPGFDRIYDLKNWRAAARNLLKPEHIQRLEDEQERDVLMHRFFENYSLKYLANKYGVSQSHISDVENLAHHHVRRMIRLDTFPSGVS